MTNPTLAHQLAAFACSLNYEDLSRNVVHEVKRRLIDSLGCALGAWNEEPCTIARNVVSDFSAENGATVGPWLAAPGPRRDGRVPFSESGASVGEAFTPFGCRFSAGMTCRPPSVDRWSSVLHSSNYESPPFDPDGRRRS